MAEIEFVWAVVVTIILVGVAVYAIRKITNLQNRINQKQTNAYNAGINRIKGEITQILASFSLLNDYNQIAVLGSISTHISLDLIGIKDDSVDFIEVKKKGAGLSENENKVKNLIDNGHVRYVVVDGEFPPFTTTYRP